MVLLGLSTFVYVASATPKETELLPKVGTQIATRPIVGETQWPPPMFQRGSSPYGKDEGEYTPYRFLGWSKDGRYYAFEFEHNVNFPQYDCGNLQIEFQVVDAKTDQWVPNSRFVYQTPMIKMPPDVETSFEKCVFSTYSEMYPAYIPVREALLSRYDIELGNLLHPIWFKDPFMVEYGERTTYARWIGNQNEQEKVLQTWEVLTTDSSCVTSVYVDLFGVDSERRLLTLENPSIGANDTTCDATAMSTFEADFISVRTSMMEAFDIPVSGQVLNDGKIMTFAEMLSFGGWSEVERGNDELFASANLHNPSVSTKSLLLSDGTKVTFQLISERKYRDDGVEQGAAYTLYMLSPKRKTIQRFKQRKHVHEYALQAVFVSPNEKYAAVMIQKIRPETIGEDSDESVLYTTYMSNGVQIR